MNFGASARRMTFGALALSGFVLTTGMAARAQSAGPQMRGEPCSPNATESINSKQLQARNALFFSFAMGGMEPGQVRAVTYKAVKSDQPVLLVQEK
jgi:hypothetical protein